VGELMRMLRSSRVLRSEKVGDGTNFVIEAKRRSEEPISIVVESDNSSDILVEFEGGTKNSLFGPATTNQMRGWGAELQHGFG
jgi:hypothetical protein